MPRRCVIAAHDFRIDSFKTTRQLGSPTMGQEEEEEERGDKITSKTTTTAS